MIRFWQPVPRLTRMVRRRNWSRCLTSSSLPAEKWAEFTLKGVGQVVFVKSSQPGAWILGSLAVGDPYLAYLAALGAFTLTGTAQALKLDTTTLQNGLWAYNGCLIGCMSAVFVSPTSAIMGTLCTILAAPAATVVTAALPRALPSGMPQWTIGFNLVALSQLTRLQPFLETTSSSSGNVTAATEAVSVTLSSIFCTPFVGLSQIFVVESPWTGLSLTMAVATYSPLLMAHAVTGSAVGSLIGCLCLGAPTSEITSGLWGYNSALTSMGIGVFFVHSRPTWALSVAGAAATAAVFGGLKVVFMNLGASPCLTLPFCVTMSGCWLLAPAMPSLLTLAANPSFPERNIGPPDVA